MVSIGIALLVAGVCFYIGMLYTNPTIVMLGFAVCVLFLLSIVELLLRFFTVKCHLEIPISMAEQNQPVNIWLRMENKLLLPIRRVDVQAGVRNQLGTFRKKQWISLYDCKLGNSKHNYQVVLTEAGCHEIDVAKMRIYGMFGLFYITKKCRDFASVMILPDIHSTGITISERVRNFLGDADIYDDFRPGHDPGETFEIREYREKDKLQSIHWKLSAKMDELMVKENSLPKACAIVLMLQLTEEKKQKFAKRRRKQNGSAYLELIASISYTLMDQKCPHFVAWYSKEKEDVRRIRVDDEESFYLFWDCFLREAGKTDKDIREEYRNKYKSEWYLYDLCINDQLEIWKNGEYVTKLDEKKIVNECEKLELLL